jgi:SAM-dependent methyltransferase
MPELAWNEREWSQKYDWALQGEEWSSAWGSSESQWSGSLFPRLKRFLPSSRILEIGPGFGRWTHFLLPHCKSFVGVDMSADCIDACTRRFDGLHATFFKNDGLDLSAAVGKSLAADKFDLIFSFDSLVHADQIVMTAYIPQIISALTFGGRAFIHHSNALSLQRLYGNKPPHNRAHDVDHNSVEAVVIAAGGKVVLKELINWGCDELIDCISVIARVDNHGVGYQDGCDVIINRDFMKEANIIRLVHDKYR